MPERSNLEYYRLRILSDLKHTLGEIRGEFPCARITIAVDLDYADTTNLATAEGKRDCAELPPTCRITIDY